jgi:hypothetical protein
LPVSEPIPYVAEAKQSVADTHDGGDFRATIQTTVRRDAQAASARATSPGRSIPAAQILKAALLIQDDADEVICPSLFEVVVENSAHAFFELVDLLTLPSGAMRGTDDELVESPTKESIHILGDSARQRRDHGDTGSLPGLVGFQRLELRHGQVEGTLAIGGLPIRIMIRLVPIQAEQVFNSVSCQISALGRVEECPVGRHVEGDSFSGSLQAVCAIRNSFLDQVEAQQGFSTEKKDSYLFQVLGGESQQVNAPADDFNAHVLWLFPGHPTVFATQIAVCGEHEFHIACGGEHTEDSIRHNGTGQVLHLIYRKGG